ncbi:MAG: C-terminal binding protein [Kiritimatiellae bacterium]|nr:C-terminal binding protein [Kiritimatiellia bacterium]
MNDTLKAVITDYAFDNIELEREALAPLGCRLEVLKAGKGQALIDLVKDADAVITQFAHLTDEVINAMQKCRVIVRYGIGVDNVDLKAAAAKNIPVCNVPDYCIDEVADHTLALILAATRQLGPCDNAIKAGQWKLPVALTALHALKYMTVGLVAFGRIGREVAARLKAFKCKILVFDPALPESVIKDAGCVPATLDDVFAQSDLITLHCPSVEKTRGMINAVSLAQMKKGVILVNTSRGTLIDTGALVAALQSGQVAAAAIDVADPEPINADSPLLKMDNVVMTPHVASATPQAVRKLRIDAVGIAALALRGESVPNIVNGVRQA